MQQVRGTVTMIQNVKQDLSVAQTIATTDRTWTTLEGKSIVTKMIVVGNTQDVSQV